MMKIEDDDDEDENKSNSSSSSSSPILEERLRFVEARLDGLARTVAELVADKLFRDPANSKAPVDSPGHNEADPFVDFARRLADKSNATQAQSDFFIMQLRNYPEPTRRRAMQQVLLMLAEGKQINDPPKYTLFLCSRGHGHEGGSWAEFGKTLAATKPRAHQNGPKTNGEAGPIKLQSRHSMSREEEAEIDRVMDQIHKERQGGGR